MKAFISQPMNRLSDEEIKNVRDTITKAVEKLGAEVINSIVEETPPNLNDEDLGIYYLGKSIQMIAEADLVYFAPGWEDARGCKIEFEVAKEYGKNIMIFGKH